MRFNKHGSMLAVNTSDNVIKILANNDGINLIKMMDRRSNNGSRGLTEALNSKVTQIFSRVLILSRYVSP